MIIKIKNFEVETSIGVYDWEKSFPRKLMINLELHSKIDGAFLSDDIKDTLDYDLIYNKIHFIIKNRYYNLIEKLGYDILEELFKDFKEFNIFYGKIEIDKLNLKPDIYSCSIMIEKKL
jgi:dihydroneopterin aldolase